VWVSRAARSQTTAHMHGHHEATMGLAGTSLGRELTAQSYTPHRDGDAGVAPPAVRSQSQSRAQTVRPHTLTTQMVGGIKPSSPGMKSMSRQACSLPTMSSPSGEERTPGASAAGRARWMVLPPL
jgi:hypothetical protein